MTTSAGCSRLGRAGFLETEVSLSKLCRPARRHIIAFVVFSSRVGTKALSVAMECTKSSVPKGCQAWPGILKTGIRGGLLPPEAPRAPPSCWASLPCTCMEGRAKRVPPSCHRATTPSCHNPSLGGRGRDSVDLSRQARHQAGSFVASFNAPSS